MDHVITINLEIAKLFKVWLVVTIICTTKDRLNHTLMFILEMSIKPKLGTFGKKNMKIKVNGLKSKRTGAGGGKRNPKPKV